MSANGFGPGTIVQHKTTGQVMLVIQVRTPDEVLCEWWIGPDHHRHERSFPTRALKHASPSLLSDLAKLFIQGAAKK